MYAQLRRAAARSSGWVTSKNVVPMISDAVRSSSRSMAGLHAVITPCGVSTAMPIGAFSNALARSGSDGPGPGRS